MKRSLYICGVIIGIFMLLVSAYLLINIYFVCSVNNEIMYDGFGTAYHFNKPYSPYTLPGVVFLFGGVSILTYSYNKISEIKENIKLNKK